MSIYTNESFTNAAFERLKIIDPSIEASVIPRLRVMLAPALESLAQKVGSSPDRQMRNLLRKSLGTVAVTSGVGSLAALQTGVQPILLDEIAIRSADIRTSTGQKLQILPDRSSLDQDRPAAFLFGAVEGSSLYTDAPNGNLTVIANYIETDVANLPSQLIPMLFNEVLSAWTPQAKAA